VLGDETVLSTILNAMGAERASPEVVRRGDRFNG